MVSNQCISQDLSDGQTIEPGHIILATAVVDLLDQSGKSHAARALLDSASQLNFITRSLAQKLKLNLIKSTKVVGGIGECQTKVTCSTTATISSRTNDFTSTLSFLVLPSITGLQPDCEINIKDWNIPTNLKLADPKFNSPQKIDILLGADIFFKLFDGQRINLGIDCPALLHSEFGWILSGRCKSNSSSQNSLTLTEIKPDHDMYLEEIVKQFWTLEKLPDTNKNLTREHAECEQHFKQYVRRHHDGHFMVKLPLKLSPSVLGDSKSMAIRRFFSLEKRISNDIQLKQDYSEFLSQYESDGHMKKVPWPEKTTNQYFMPHHCVLRPDKSTTKCRVVFDASAKASNGISLNEIMMTGPVVQPELFTILLRFRLHKFGLMADIKAMYRQIYVYPEDQDVQNIVWRNNMNERVQLYKLITVTYGTTAAPYLATRCLVKLAEDHLDTKPFAANIILNNFYVDDLIAGGSTLDEIHRIKHEVSSLLASAKFELRKWHSNHQEFLKQVPEHEREKTVKLSNSEVVKALGIVWNSTTDEFKFNYCANKVYEQPVTKRKVLSQLAKLFDPIGVINPIIVKAKVFLQELWIKGLAWDEPLSNELAAAWTTFADELIHLNDLKIPRFVLIHKFKIQLHGFADASSRAFGCCFYLRCIDPQGNIAVNLYTAKSKVAPISIVRSMPCLELCAAHLMTKLLTVVRNLVPTNEVTLWSDSVIVLGWLAEHASNYNTFVANRVSYIQENTMGCNWRYVPSSSNPADIISRGASVSELATSIWFHGPAFFLKSTNHWPVNPKRISATELPDRRPQKSILLSVNQQSYLLNIIYNCSNFQKNLRKFAYVRRFIRNCHSRVQRTFTQVQQPTAKELDDAFLQIIAMIQQEDFGTEFDQCKQSKEISSSSTLKGLNPFIESENGLLLLKVGGRLKNANLPYEAKCPIILPKKNQFIQCYVRHLHITNMHAGAQTLVGIIRQRFWIVGARDYARKVIKQCVHCFKYRPKLLGQIMGNLPRERVIPVKPFTHSGVDFCGPILTTYRIRGKPKYKTYIAVFVCFATHATHLEVVSDLTTDAFLAALKRFVARRGLCTTLYLDNATNFVGARNKLREFKDVFLSQQSQQQITTWCAKNMINFQHIPPRSPHFGGIWEAAVKSAKTILYKTMGSAVLTFEELSTLVTQVEGILNSRPLTALSTDPSDELALTPAHFLNLTNSQCLLEPQFSSQQLPLLKHWHQIIALQQHFWKRWSKEFLTTLQHRRKWDKNVPNIEPGVVVMVHDDNLPPQQWLLGRVTQVFKGNDEKIRVAEIKTKAGFLRRSIVKLAALPLEDYDWLNRREGSRAAVCSASN